MKLKKRYYLLFILFCLCLGMAIKHFHWTEQWNRYGPPLAVAIIIGSGVINLGYNVYYSRKINALLPLQQEGHYIEYLAEMEPIRCRVKSKHIQSFCVLSMAATYDNMGEFQQALALLHTIPEKTLLKEHRNVYHLNLATCYFHNQQNSEGLEYYEKHEGEILGLNAYPRYQPYVEVLKLYAFLEKGYLEEARQQIEFVREYFDLEVIPEDLDWFEERVNEASAIQ